MNEPSAGDGNPTPPGSGGPQGPPPLPGPGPFAAGVQPGNVSQPEGFPPPPDVDTSDGARPLFHHTQQTRTYPCEACGGELHYDISSRQLRCQHCGVSHPIAEDSGPVVERDLVQSVHAIAALQAAPVSHQEKEVVCQNCGGHTTFTGSLTADKCPYCATPIQRDDIHEAPDRLAVDGVLPFEVDEKHATQLVDAWVNGRWFAPSEFKKYNQTGSLESVYTAYFTYDAQTRTSYTGQRGDHYTVTVGHGENRRTETRTRWSHRSGVVGNGFDDIPVFANTGFDNKRIQKLEPWPTENSKHYAPEYIAGHLCRTYDRDVSDCWQDAEQVMEAEISSTVKRDIGGDQQRINSMEVSWDSRSYKHLLLPIWLMVVIYQQKPFQLYINGVTGEVHGARPWSKVKIAAAIVAALIIVACIAGVAMTR